MYHLLFLRFGKNELVDSSFVLNYFSKSNSVADYKRFVEYDFKEQDLLGVSDLLLEKNSGED